MFKNEKVQKSFFQDPFPRLKCRVTDFTKNSQLEENEDDPGTFAKSEKL